MSWQFNFVTVDLPRQKTRRRKDIASLPLVLAEAAAAAVFTLAPLPLVLADAAAAAVFAPARRTLILLEA